MRWKDFMLKCSPNTVGGKDKISFSSLKEPATSQIMGNSTTISKAAMQIYLIVPNTISSFVFFIICAPS